MAYAQETTRLRGPQTLCDSCAHQQLVRNTRGSVFSLCRRSRNEPERFPRYPQMPVLQCVGFALDEHEQGHRSDDDRGQGDTPT